MLAQTLCSVMETMTHGAEVRCFFVVFIFLSFLFLYLLGGVTTSLSESLVALVIKESAHHLDLFWSNEADPESVRNARETERSYMHLWVNEARERNLLRKER